jgi:hypothetical protein
MSFQGRTGLVLKQVPSALSYIALTVVQICIDRR